ncbi:MAG: STAS domain-containing protein [Humibacillus sp.]|nr:STAS domain-containing protein [Humibacillus sp.]MDN5778200.1 STAS domain-containing protein [Humibacillus sp.]
MTDTEPPDPRRRRGAPDEPSTASDEADAKIGGRLWSAVRAYPIFRPRSLVPRSTLKEDGVAGLVLGVESVPDGLASGLLAGVNPVFGLYAGLFGMVGGALFTSTASMAVQATGAMSIIVADVDLGGRDDPARSLFTLSIVTGVVMLLAGLLRLGTFLRFVSNSVMTGFVTAVGINIVLGQLGDLTGYDAEGGGRIARALNVVFHFWQIDLPTFVVGAATIALIVVLQRTRLGALGLVVAVALGSAIAALFGLFDRNVALVADIADVPRSLPFFTLPVFGEMPGLLVPAISLAFVGLVQGAGVSAGVPNSDGTPSDVSQDFVGQGVGNVVSGLFQGMPGGGSMSASSLVTSAGGKSRASLLFAGVTMTLVVLLFGTVVGYVAMPSLAALLIVVGVGTIKPARVMSVARTGVGPLTLMSVTLVLTMVIPLQYAVLVGVGLSVVVFVAGSSNRLVTKRLVFRGDGRVEQVDPPAEVASDDVIVLQPYGAIFFATADALRGHLPVVTPRSRNSVVILRLRGQDDAGSTVIEVLRAYASQLIEADCRLMIVTDSDRVLRQLRLTGITELIGPDRIYRSTSFLREATRQANADAADWIRSRPSSADE